MSYLTAYNQRILLLISVRQVILRTKLQCESKEVSDLYSTNVSEENSSLPPTTAAATAIGGPH